ncbi:hypothetical protein [Sphingomonas sp. Leaf339]|uniref:hypothetical protein n=1 Tax=Sphingomonas sp. Leaf339 TaxID=1736343 RepID=UPI0012E3AC7A|nr:hypothetical protein [Sphingomonas sp. Leaf339]
MITRNWLAGAAPLALMAHSAAAREADRDATAVLDISATTPDISASTDPAADDARDDIVVLGTGQTCQIKTVVLALAW